MKARAAALFLALLLLAGCGAQEPEKTYRFDGLTVTLAGDFADLSTEDYAQGYSFFYGSTKLSILGMRTGKEYLPDFTLREYAGLMLRKNKLDCEIQETDGLYWIEYTSSVDDQGSEYCYLAAFYETETDFWTVQTYCPRETYGENREAMQKLLKEIRCN